MVNLTNNKYYKLLNKFIKLNPKEVFDINSDFVLRANDRIEWICSCGTGHTIYAPKDKHGYRNYVHGCCYNRHKNKLTPCCEHLKIIK